MKNSKASVVSLLTIHNPNFVACDIIFDEIVFYEYFKFKEFS